jgi:D-aspartate ligase
MTAALRRIDSATPVVALKMTRSLVQHGVLGIARSLGRLGADVHWVHNCSEAPAARSRYITASHPTSATSAETGRWVDHLSSVGAGFAHRPVLVATDDPSAALVADHARTLGQWFRFPVSPAGITRTLANKRALHDLARSLNVDTPEALFPVSAADVEDYAATGPFPVVVKRVDGTAVDASTPPSVTIVNTHAELRRFVRRGVRAGQVMLQEYVPGDATSVWMFEGYFDDSSACVVGFTGQKVRQHPPHTGMTSLGVAMENPEVVEAATRLIGAIGYRGPVDMGFRFDVRTGAYRLLDVNPRIGSTFRLFVDTRGLDVVRAMYLDLTAQRVPARAGIVPGRRWMVEHSDALTALELIREGALSVPEWIRSLRDVREGAWLSARDPLPAVLMGAALIRQRRRRALETRHRSPRTAFAGGVPEGR